MTIAFWIDQLSALMSLILVILSLRVFQFPNASYVRAFTILNIIQEIAGVMIMFFPAPLNAIAIANNIVILSELGILTFVFLTIIRSKIYRSFLVGVFIFCYSYLLTSLLTDGFAVVLPALPHTFF